MHIDQDQSDCAEAVGRLFPNIRVIVSKDHVGPGGGRNILVKAAANDFVASFDDDSYPIDSAYFSRALELFLRFPNASIICAAVSHPGENIQPDILFAEWCADFAGGACVYNREKFLATGGYVPLPIAYGMEEVDLAIRLHAQGGRILRTSWLRVFHDTNLDRHADPEITGRSVANLALLAYLRYPPSLWPLGMLQCANRILWLLSHGRRRGILSGLRMIPAHLRAHKRYKMRVGQHYIKSYLALRRSPLTQVL